jgi:tetratricopeptide (TPR) repeat protein
MKTRHEPSKKFRAKTHIALLSLMTLFPLTRPSFAAPLSELLEKGIYSEETKGDLDGAMKLYEQIVAEGKGGQAVAAQAQYRLGVCYYKKKDYAKASATFEKLVKDYPDQKELVALAQEYLAGAATLLPAPWVDGELLRLDIKLGSGFRIGPATYSASSGETNGRKIWKLGSRLFAGVQQLSSVEVEADSFKPLHSRWKHTLLGDADAVYGAGHADLKFKGKDEIKKIEIESLVYDNEEVVQLMRRLPLATNYSTRIQILSTLAGGNIIPLKIEVAGIDKVQVGAGSFDCYRVELSVKQTFWYSTDEHHYLVKFEAGGVSAELTSIEQTTPGQPVAFKMASPALSLSAPSGWLFDTHEPDEAKAPGKIVILDPDATATSFLFVNNVDNLNLKPEEKKSLRACADAQIVEGTRTLKDLKVRADTWKDRTVAGQPALSVVADFVESREKKVSYLVFTFLENNALQFLTCTDPADFEAFRPQFDAIIDSCKANP